MDVKSLGRRMTGYTAKVPGTKASKTRLRRILLSMVRQIEIETTDFNAVERHSGEKAGQIPCLFGTLTSQRYQWNQLIEIIATVERGQNPDLPQVSNMSKGKRRELVNKYPLIVAWYAALRMELVLKSVVVPVFKANAYAAVFEWSPTGGMVHLHYILWKPSSPRFDLRSEDLVKQAKLLQRAGIVAAAEVNCKMDDVIDFFSEYINEWNPNKDDKGDDLPKNTDQADDIEHPAALDIQSLLRLLQSDMTSERLKYYQRCVKKEHMHDFHYPDPTGPPSYAQPCAQLLKGTTNMYYCKNGYPRELVCDVCHENISQDALRPELWRVNMCRNCPVMNPHMPLVTCVMQSNTDACSVCTLGQCEKYLCKYCSKHGKRVGQKSVLFDVLSDMQRRDEMMWEKDPSTFEATKLGSKMHKAFMDEVGEEMCQAELAHHANQSPEWLVSRDIRDVYFYKRVQALSIRSKQKDKTGADDDWEWESTDDDHVGAQHDDWDDENATGSKSSQKKSKPVAKPSDVDLYEGRWWYDFASDTMCSKRLPHVRMTCTDYHDCQCPTSCDVCDLETVASTPYEQLLKMSAFQFFWLVRFIGGRYPKLQWHDDGRLPIVLMSPTIKLMEGPDFSFHARWCLMQHHPWDNRREFLDKSDEDVVTYFRSWIESKACPGYVMEDYLKANGMKSRLGAGAFKPPRQKGADKQEDPTADGGEEDAHASEEECDAAVEEEEVIEDHVVNDEMRVLRALRDGYIQEIDRNTETQRRWSMQNAKHDFYRKTRCTNTAQEEQSATIVGVMNVCQDSEDDDEYWGDQKEVQAEMQELRAAAQWINPSHMDTDEEAYALDSGAHKVDLRCPLNAKGKIITWEEVKKMLSGDVDETREGAVGKGGRKTYKLEDLDPTQRVFADRVLKWGTELINCYRTVENDGKPRDIPLLRTWLCGSAGSGKSTTLKTVVHHLRIMFDEASVPSKIELTAYTGVAAFNIGFGARTTCAGFQIFPNANWKMELDKNKARALEDQWADVELLIVDEISFIGRALFARMHYRMQQGRRRHFAETAKKPENASFGDVSIILVGDFGQLEPIDDFSLCDLHPSSADCPQRLNSIWKHAKIGFDLASLFKEAVLLKRIHRSKEDMWWTESCLRLRNLDANNVDEFAQDYDHWRKHDLDRGHFSEEQKTYFETYAVWLCARCEDVGTRNGRKLAHLAEDSAKAVHRIRGIHSHKSSKQKSAEAFSGLRSVINLVRGCKIMITRNVAYLHGLANGTRGTLVGVVYPRGSKMGCFPEAVIVSIPEYRGPMFYLGEPTWVPILAMSDFQGSQSRTQFPIVAGFAMTINKSQGLTIKEGAVINLQGTVRFRPASLHGLPFVALTRSESFAMTAFKNIPPLDDFLKGLESKMLKTRKQFDRHLHNLHRVTLKDHSSMTTAEDEDRAYATWCQRKKVSSSSAPATTDGRPLICAACNM